MGEPGDILNQIARVFSDLRIDYMIVGSMAMRAYVPGRSTFDTDILVRMTPAQLAQLHDELRNEWLFEWETAARSLESKSMFNIIHYKTSWKLDLIPLKDNPYHQEEFARRRREQLQDAVCFVQTPEDLVLSKLEWGKRSGSTRQMEDVRSILNAGLQLDEPYLQRWAGELGLSARLQEARDG
jgi:hypothetical protein